MKTNLILLLTLFTSGLFAQTETEIIHIDRNKKNSKPVFVRVEEMPEFSYKNGKSTNASFSNFVKDSIHAPSDECLGKAYVQFVVKPDSTVTRARVLKGLEKCPDYREKVERIIESMPKWKPGKQRGKFVRVQLVMPIDIESND
jgi:protein TonB